MKMLIDFLIKNYGYEAGNWRLAVAKPLAKELGEIDADVLEGLKKEVNLEFADRYPSIARHGQAHIAAFFSQMEYDWCKEELIKAAKKVKAG